LAVASSTDELLRASWVELEVIDAPPPVMAPPPAVVRAVAESQGRRPPPTRASLVSSFEIGADVDASSLPGNREAGGAALELRGWFLPRGAVLLETGGDLGLSRTSIHGTVHVNDLFVTVGTAIAAVPRDRRLGVDLEAGVSFLRVSLGGTASAGATASPAVDWAAVFRLGARAWVRTGPVRWTLGFAGLGVARGSRGIDTGEDVSSIAGLGLEASLGAFIAF
jgi:hypothetical protein